MYYIMMHENMNIKPEINLSNIYKCSFYYTENILLVQLQRQEN